MRQQFGSLETLSQGRSFIKNLPELEGKKVILAGWVRALRVHAKTTFLVLQDASGEVQIVLPNTLPAASALHLECCVRLVGTVHKEVKAKGGWEVWAEEIEILNPATAMPPFQSGKVHRSAIALETQVENRPLFLRSDEGRAVFRLQAFLIGKFREYLTKNYFTEICTSKLVASGTEGGSNLFKLKYFEKVAYLAQSPQFYKEQCVAGLERVFETAHVYRAEPHATSRHLTEYYSLDVEMGFIRGPEEVIELERELLEFIFSSVQQEFASELESFGVSPLPSWQNVPVWEFSECLERLRAQHGRSDLFEDLDGEAERQLCAMAEAEFGVPAVFVLGFPLRARPFYTAPRGTQGAAQSFDLLYKGLEITTGGQRLHRRAELEAALRLRGMQTEEFSSHLKMFELGMPPHGGFAIGAERLTAQILGLSNVREATLYPRDRNRLTP